MISGSSHNLMRHKSPRNRKEARRCGIAAIRERHAGKKGRALEQVRAGEYGSVIEGILFAMGDSVEVERIANAIGISVEQTEKELEALAYRYEMSGRGIRLLKLEDSYQMCTASEIYEYLIRIAKQPKKQVLTDVLMETLSIIAYKQPVTKAEIEKIRGVSCDHAVSKLVEYHLVEELGRLEAPGRPMLFGTTEDFLRSFGVTSLSELPVLNPVQVEEFKLQAEAEANETLSVEI